MTRWWKCWRRKKESWQPRKRRKSTPKCSNLRQNHRKVTRHTAAQTALVTYPLLPLSSLILRSISHLAVSLPAPSPAATTPPVWRCLPGTHGLSTQGRSCSTALCALATCPRTLYTALMDHERKHSNQHMIQCNSCSRFHKLEGHGCHFCRK